MPVREATIVLVALAALAVARVATPVTAATAKSAPPYVTCQAAEQRASRTAMPDSNVLKQIAAIKIQIARPHDPGAMEYLLAETYAQARQYCNALGYLSKVVALHQGWDPSGDPLFADMNGIAAYNTMVHNLAREFPAVRNSRTAFVIHKPTMVPENVSFDPQTKTWYVSSIYLRNVVKVDSRGQVSDFLHPRQYGLWSVIGMKIDPATKLLWICSAALYEKPDVQGAGALLAVDLKSGRIIHRYAIPGGKRRHLLNDLVLDRAGSIYITDSLANTMYWLPAHARALQVFIPGFQLNFPNGLDLDAAQRKLYVASFGGIDVIDLSTRKHRKIGHPHNVTIEGIDGMYYYRGSLVAVQNGIGAERVTRFYLDESGSNVVRAQTLEYRNPLFQQPTEGSLTGPTLYYLANSQNAYLSDRGALDRRHRFVDPVVLKLEL